MKRLLCFLMLVSTFQLAQAQDSTSYCGTADMDTTEFKQLPWFDNNDVLEDYLDSIGYTGGSGGSSNRIMTGGIRYRIPVSWWIYRDDAGNGGPNLQQIQLMMDKLNHLFLENNTGIAFYMKCNIHYVNNSNHVNKTFVGANLLIADDRDLGAINIHVVNSIGGGVGGIGLKPFNGLIITSTSYNSGPTSTLAHEMGHVLGLVHTHLYSAWNFKCLTECISRTRDWPFFNLCPAPRWKEVCESTGDALRDTPADPNLINNFSCSYVGGGTDPWGDSYASPPHGEAEKPDPRNVMSYNAQDNCISIFSRLQIGVMLRTIKHQKNSIDESHWKDAKYTFDSFEPDNSSVIARTIGHNETQERNFHQQYNNSGLAPSTTQCDEDWVRFTAITSGTILITTSAMAGYTNANTRLTLYNSALTQLAQNDNISSTNLYSSISFNATGGQTYFIRIDNMSPGVTSFYNLFVSCPNASNPSAYQPDGPTSFCTSGIYSIPNLPAGSTVSWSVSPGSVVSLTNYTTPQVTASTINSGTFNLTATITLSCGSTFNVTKNNIRAGVEWYGDVWTSADQSLILQSWAEGRNYIFENTEVHFQINGTTSASQYTYLAGNLSNTPYFDWGYMHFYMDPGGWASFAVTVTIGGCTQTLHYDFQAINWPYWNYYSIAPNPVSSELTIYVDDEKLKNQKIQKSPDQVIQQVSIVDKFGNVLVQQKYPPNQKRVTLNVSNLSADVYVARIYDGKKWTSIKFIKK